MSGSAISIARGIGIILVVVAHLGVSLPVLPIYTFHMPLFFLIGGITFKASRSWRQVARFTLVDMLLYAAVMIVGYALLGQVLHAASGVSLGGSVDWHRLTVGVITGQGTNGTLALTSWFLVAYALSQAVAYVLHRSGWLRRPLVEAAIGLALLYVGVRVFGRSEAVGEWELRLASQVFSGTGLVLLGHAVASRAWLDRMIQSSWVPIAAIVLPIWAHANFQRPLPSMMEGSYPSGYIYFTVVALSASFAILWLSSLIDGSRPGRWLATVGHESKAVMAHHLFVFAIINVGLVLIGQLKPEEVGVFTAFDRQASWPIYTVLGTALPVFAGIAWRRRVSLKVRYRLR